MQEDIEDTKLSLDLAYANAKHKLNNSMIIIQNQKGNAKLAKDVLSNTKNNYLQGLASLTDLLMQKTPTPKLTKQLHLLHIRLQASRNTTN
jgi:hypothetical protein